MSHLAAKRLLQSAHFHDDEVMIVSASLWVEFSVYKAKFEVFLKNTLSAF